MYYEKFIAKNKDWIDSVFEKIDKKLSKTAVKSRDKLPYTVNADGIHDDHKNNIRLWTNGFLGGLMWLMYEATAGAIMACGLIEIAKAVSEYEKKLYLDAAVNILKALDEKSCDWDENRDAILLMCNEAYVSKCHPDHNIIYGDFFFTEAILKLKGSTFLYQT